MRQSEVLAYTAGIIDGEGCISIAKRKRPTHRNGYGYELVVHVTNTNEWLVHWLQMQYGGYVAFHKRQAPYKDIWNWDICNHKAQGFLESILPYLQMKRPQGELAIKFQAAKLRNWRGKAGKTDEEWAVQEAQRILMGQYNQRGKHPKEEVQP